MTFHDIYAVADTRPRCYFSFEDEEEQYFEHGFIHLYGIPDDLSESDVENIYNGGSDKSIYIGEIIGTLILGNQMSEDGEDFLMFCDDMSADLSYVASTFMFEDLIDVNTGVLADIYYREPLKTQFERKRASHFMPLCMRASCALLAAIPRLPAVTVYCVKPPNRAWSPRQRGGVELARQRG